MDPNIKNCIGKSSDDIAEVLARYIEMDARSHNVIILQEYLRVALNRELIETQKPFQEAYLRKTQWLVLGTWALVIVTLLMAAVAQSSSLHLNLGSRTSEEQKK